MAASGKIDNKDIIDRFGDNDKKKLVKKPGKLKDQKLSKSQKLAKSRKKLSKNGNLLIFDTRKARSTFLTSNTKTAFNYLRLAFIKASILWYFDPKCYFCCKTNILGYVISIVLKQLASKTKPNEVVTKTNLS